PLRPGHSDPLARSVAHPPAPACAHPLLVAGPSPSCAPGDQPAGDRAGHGAAPAVLASAGAAAARHRGRSRPRPVAGRRAPALGAAGVTAAVTPPRLRQAITPVLRRWGLLPDTAAKSRRSSTRGRS